MTPTVTLHVKTYIAAWLTRNYGSPVNLPRKSTFKNVVLACLTKKFYDSREYDLASYPAKVEVKLPANDLSIHGVGVQLQLQHHLNAVIENEIKNELFMFIYAHHLKGVTIDRAVLLYQVTQGFTESTFTQEAIRTAYFKRKRKFDRIFCGTDTIKM